MGTGGNVNEGIIIKETTYLLSYYRETEVATAEQFITLLEDRFEEIQKAFHFNVATQKCTFRLGGSVEEYIVATGKTKEEYQDWMVGHSNADTHTICLIPPMYYAGKPKYRAHKHKCIGIEPEKRP